MLRKPDWFKIKIQPNENFKGLKKLVHGKGLHTVCEEASCPNIHECWGNYATASFMILGDTCTRRCRFCDVKTGVPGDPDPLEPRKIAVSVKEMGLKHAFITMVNRDDLADGGSILLAATVEAIRHENPGCSIEILSSDMMGRQESIARLVDSKPDILGHNIETVERLTPIIRSRSDYKRSLNFLGIAKELNPGQITKSSMMLGLGETLDEIKQSLQDLRKVDCNIINIGQYLQPSRSHAPVKKYWHPDEFKEIKTYAKDIGFMHVESGPHVRSSYHAGEQFDSFSTSS